MRIPRARLDYYVSSRARRGIQEDVFRFSKRREPRSRDVAEIWGDMGRYGEIWREPRPRDAADKLPQRVCRVVGDEVAVDEHLMGSE